MKKGDVMRLALVPLCIELATSSASSLAGPVPAGNTVTTNVADYNAAQVGTANGSLVVPANLLTYSASVRALPIGNFLKITLPTNFTFATQPSLTANVPSTTTFTVVAGGNGSQSVTFQVATADLAVGQSASLNTFVVAGASALQTLIPVSAALPVTVQGLNADPAPLSAGAFASEPGVGGVFVGAIQFIDLNPPSLGRLFGTGGVNDTATAVLSAIALSAESVDAVTQSHPVLGSNGLLNSLSANDTATVTLTGYVPSTGGIAKVFASVTSDCQSPEGSPGTVTGNVSTIPNVPFNREVFFCATADGKTVLTQSPNGFTSVAITPGSSTDFLAGGQTNIEFPGLTTYFPGGSFTPFSEVLTAPSFSNAIRIVNNSGAIVPVYAIVQGDGGSTGTVVVEQGLAPYAGDLVSVSRIIANAGVSVPNDTASITIITIGSEVSVSNLLSNPDGTVVQLGSSQSQQN